MPRARKLILCGTWVAVKLFPVRPHVKGFRDVATGRLPYLLDQMNSSIVTLLGSSCIGYSLARISIEDTWRSYQMGDWAPKLED